MEKKWFGLGICFSYDRYDQRGVCLDSRDTLPPLAHTALETARILWRWAAVLRLKIGVVGVLFFTFLDDEGLVVFGFVIYH